MYYCHTRYYVPEWGRWLNADHCAYLELDNINGMNLFAYCANNPIMYNDPEGTRLKWWQKLLVAVAVVLVVVGTSIITGGATAAVAGMAGELAVVGGGVVGGGAAVAAGIGAVVVGSAAVATGVVAGGIVVESVLDEMLNANVWYAKGNGPRIGHNSHENNQYKAAMDQLNIKKGSKNWEIGHRELLKAKKAGEYFEELSDLVEFLESIFGL